MPERAGVAAVKKKKKKNSRGNFTRGPCLSQALVPPEGESTARSQTVKRKPRVTYQVSVRIPSWTGSPVASWRKAFVLVI